MKTIKLEDALYYLKDAIDDVQRDKKACDITKDYCIEALSSVMLSIKAADMFEIEDD